MCFIGMPFFYLFNLKIPPNWPNRESGSFDSLPRRRVESSVEILSFLLPSVFTFEIATETSRVA